MAEKTIEEVTRKARELYEKADAAAERKNYDYAVETLISALEIEPAFLRARHLLRRVEMAKAGKKGFLSKGFRSVGSLPAVARSRAAARKGNGLEALKLAEEALRESPTNLQALEALADAGEAAELPEIAVLALETAGETHPKNLDVLRKLSKAYLAVDEMEKAVACQRRILTIRPSDSEAQKALKDTQALRTMRRGKWDQASSYREVLRDEDESRDLEREGRAVRSVEDTDALLLRLEREIEETGNIATMRRVASLYREKKDFENAITAYQRVIDAEAQSDPMLERVVTDIRIEQVEARIHEAREAAGDDVDEQLAALEAEKNRIRVDSTRELVERYPNNLEFRFDLAELLFEDGRIDDALGEYQQAQRSPQHRLRCINAMGLCFLAKEMDDLAVGQFETALDAGVEDPDLKKEILYNLASSLERTGDRDRADDRYKEIYQEDIGFRDVAAKIEAAYRRKKEKSSGGESGPSGD